MIRIERQDPLHVLSELPDGWAQTIITGPPDGADLHGIASILAVVTKLARVSRPDATLLWNVERPQPLPLRTLAGCFAVLGWQLQQSPAASSAGHLLFVKQQRFHWQPPPSRRASRIRQAPCQPVAPVRWQRRPWCIPAAGERRLERLLLTATAPAACGVCGSPWSRVRRQVPRSRLRALDECAHAGEAGRCLVLDPFHRPGSPLPALAVRHGCSFLGIQDPAHTEARR